MQPLNFPTYQFRFKSSENKILIFDPIRKKFVIRTPEEWVRQHTVQFLIHEKNIPQIRIQIEKEIQLHGVKKRYDIVVYNPDGSLHLIVECKAPSITIDQAVFDQIARYNLALKSTYLMVTNGLSHYYCQMDYKNERYIFLKELPKNN